MEWKNWIPARLRKDRIVIPVVRLSGTIMASGNALFHHMVHSIQSALEDLSLRGMRERREKASLLEVQALHEQIVERIVAGAAVGAARAMELHMDVATRVLVAE